MYKTVGLPVEKLGIAVTLIANVFYVTFTLFKFVQRAGLDPLAGCCYMFYIYILSIHFTQLFWKESSLYIEKLHKYLPTMPANKGRWHEGLQNWDLCCPLVVGCSKGRSHACRWSGGTWAKAKAQNSPLWFLFCHINGVNRNFIIAQCLLEFLTPALLLCYCCYCADSGKSCHWLWLHFTITGGRCDLFSIFFSRHSLFFFMC